MIEQGIRDQYTAVIGLEVHAQLKVQSKIFSSDSTEFGKAPNSNVSVISLGHPGTLPKLNEKVVEYAIKMGLACNCDIAQETYFDRKNYFYPDSPKGYQITQDQSAICKNGYISIRNDSATGNRKIALTKIHLEEDAGKSIHREGIDESLIDYNRAGIPLIEIVTEPDLRSASEAASFLTEIRRLVRYLDICDGNMEQGSLRCDANVSVMKKGSSTYGNKVEVKNMNSIKNLQTAIEYEIERQIEALEAGESIVSETRDFNALNGTTSSLRIKEELNDYRYFPEPDLAPLLISKEQLNAIKAKLPPLPWELQEKFVNEYKLPAYDAHVLTDSKGIALYFDDASRYCENHKILSNWVMIQVKSYLNEKNIDIDQFPISSKDLAELINLIDAGKLNNNTASKVIFPKMLVTSASAKSIAEKENLLAQSSSESIQDIINEVLLAHPDKVEQYKKGKKGLIGLFMGEIMKKTNGSADPQKTKSLLEKTLA